MKEFRTVVEELAEAKRLLTEANAKIAALENKRVKRVESMKRNRKINPEEKGFNAVLQASRKALESQQFKDPFTLNRIIKDKIVQRKYEKFTFFSIYNERIKRLKDISTFISDCDFHSLDADIVAQHIVSHGEKEMSSVFKFGLISAIGEDKLKLMKKPIFDKTELDLNTYELEPHPDSEQSIEVATQE
ncbi:hypothetical protein [Parabacteroides sp. PF5-6]|uniref:hypothetical protein n=1 Tax=Parabacteroides sp. PF5-6 TaxID=1742403 RepID=UPI0024050063|nr:hypothetical protein [Parabacteroides sp. PF5-6]MDF9830034.1 hypothetical protein [Parabacteroides sp. PF5-6]